MSDGPRYYGKYRAMVLQNTDPQFQGRIQVQLGDRYGLFPSTWAMPAFPQAGKGNGMVAMPQLGSQVWIEFEAGDPDYPIWSGAFWPDIGGFPPLALVGATPVTPNIHMQTTTGTSITLSDNPAAQVTIKTLSTMITIGSAGVTITNASGPLMITSPAGLILSTGGAQISMLGAVVDINNGALTIT